MRKSSIRQSGIWGSCKSETCNLPTLFVFAICLFVFCCSCERNITPFTQTPAQLTLSAEYVAVTAVWLQVEAGNITANQQLKIWRDTTVLFNDILTANDTTVYDGTLLPDHDYTYHATIVKDGNVLVESQPLKITTMDTTSHDFNWQIYTIASPYGSGVLRDVAIINENDIWAVGEIYADSAQPWLPYNAVHWDGQQWELKRITYGGTPWPIKSIFAFSSDDIWFDAFVKWNGVGFIQLPIPNVLIGHNINKIWGTSSNDLYVAGSEGLIAHCSGSSWEKIESGTDLPINDIWGATDPRTGEQTILCVASNKYLNEGKALLAVEGNQVTQLPDSGLSWSLSSVWFVPGQIYYVAGDGICPSRTLGPVWHRDATYPPYYKDRIKGAGINDIAVVGSNGLLSHYNGSNWKHYLNNPLPSIVGHYYGVQINNELIIAVGYDQSKAILVKGIR